MPKLIKLFKEQKRCSGTSQIEREKRYFFSHARQLTLNEFHPEVKAGWPQGVPVRIVAVKENIVEVQFPSQLETDLVSPEFLIPMELTKEGERLLLS